MKIGQTRLLSEENQFEMISDQWTEKVDCLLDQKKLSLGIIGAKHNPIQNKGRDAIRMSRRRRQIAQNQRRQIREQVVLIFSARCRHTQCNQNGKLMRVNPLLCQDWGSICRHTTWASCSFWIKQNIMCSTRRDQHSMWGQEAIPHQIDRIWNNKSKHRRTRTAQPDLTRANDTEYKVQKRAWQLINQKTEVWLITERVETMIVLQQKRRSVQA